MSSAGSDIEGRKSKGGRPKKPPGEGRDRRIVTWVNAREQARYMVNAARAGLTGADFARQRLCYDKRPGDDIASSADFELVDALSRIGADLQMLAPIIMSTGHVAEEFSQLVSKLETVLDELLPG
jgi:hypothetical protein